MQKSSLDLDFSNSNDAELLEIGDNSPDSSPRIMDNSYHYQDNGKPKSSENRYYQEVVDSFDNQLFASQAKKTRYSSNYQNNEEVNEERKDEDLQFEPHNEIEEDNLPEFEKNNELENEINSLVKEISKIKEEMEETSMRNENEIKDLLEGRDKLREEIDSELKITGELSINNGKGRNEVERAEEIQKELTQRLESLGETESMKKEIDQLKEREQELQQQLIKGEKEVEDKIKKLSQQIIHEWKTKITQYKSINS
jgi:DNA repair exonuclease SbcCD ATPase subunit